MRCTKWKEKRRRRKNPAGGYVNTYHSGRVCTRKGKPPLVAEVAVQPNIACTVQITAGGEVLYNDTCRCAETGKRRVENWLETGKGGWR